MRHEVFCDLHLQIDFTLLSHDRAAVCLGCIIFNLIKNNIFRKSFDMAMGAYFPEDSKLGNRLM